MYFMPAQTQGIHFDIHCKGGVPLGSNNLEPSIPTWR